jgi:dipeptidyl aminopeptidase/acylaminoacyl peptidase
LNRLHRIFAVGLLIGVSGAVFSAETAPGNRLPSIIARDNDTPIAQPTRGWTLRDIIEVSEISSVAVAQRPRQVGFVIRQRNVDAGTITYGLYVIDADGSGAARKILESPYMAHLSRDPNDKAWTLLTDLGTGAQVYDIDDNGASTPIIVNDQTVAMGTNDGVVRSVYEPYRSGIISYEWSPDGKSLWYSRPRLRSPEALQSFLDRGVRVDDLTMLSMTMRQHAGELLGAELHVVNRASAADRTLAFVTPNATSDAGLLRSEWANAYWDEDSKHIFYSYGNWAEDGKWVQWQYSVDVDSGESKPVAKDLQLQVAVPSADGTHYLYVSRPHHGGELQLGEYSKDGTKISDGNPVTFSFTGHSNGYGVWRNANATSEIIAVGSYTHTGLIQIPETAAGRAWSSVTDRIRQCSFAGDLSFGACVRDNLTHAPELVLVDTNTGAFKPLVRPNSRYDAIAPLRSEHTTWRNRFGHESDGYITYPRNYSVGRQYPTIVVTHGHGARNEFLEQGFQAEIPVQVLAETGYVVLSVNEDDISAVARNTLHLNGKAAARTNIARTQISVILDPVATMEAALQDGIRRGIVDPDKTGIAGYSRGAEVSVYAMTQSKMFRAAAIGDGASGVNADGYWSGGGRASPPWYISIYGGSAYDPDPRVRKSYARLSPAFRSKEFAGPLLEQCPAALVDFGLERSVLLRQAGIPVELIFYKNESHVLWHPRHIAASMQRAVEWFDFWLLGKIDPDPAKKEQYANWQAMADDYKTRRH